MWKTWIRDGFSGMGHIRLTGKGMAWKTLAFLLPQTTWGSSVLLQDVAVLTEPPYFGQASSKNDGVNSTIFLWGLGSSIFQRESPIFQAIPLP
ncbi:hypothetical protein ACFFGV_04155 [Pontibacillus salicampi]|uniref:Uncharacterized protein n=2 Tax=Pontibacillus salicampi TaxID=1449801 RepID=A0ABV6LKC2_9BACI